MKLSRPLASIVLMLALAVAATSRAAPLVVATGSVEEMVSGRARGADVVTLVARRQSLWRDAWLTATGHTRPGVKAGLPLAEAKARAAEIERALAKLNE